MYVNEKRQGSRGGKCNEDSDLSNVIRQLTFNLSDT